VSEKNLDEFLKRIETDAGTLVFFAMTPGDYELMAYNLQEVKRYIKELKGVVVYYQRVTQNDEDKQTDKPAHQE